MASERKSGVETDVRYVPGVGPQRLKLLHRLGVNTVGNLLYCFPRGYEDRTQVKKIRDLAVGERATLRVQVEAVEQFRPRSRGPWGQSMANVLFRDETGAIVGVWFRTRYFRPESFPAGREMYITGKVDYYEPARRLQMVTPQCEPVEGGLGGGFGPAIVPIYPLTEGLPQAVMRRIQRHAVDKYADSVPELLPDDLRAARKLLPIADAVRNMHFPESMDAAGAARRRLAYDEFFLIELAMAMRRLGVREQPGHAFPVTDKIDAHIRALFPFVFTAAQDRVIKEIAADMASPKPMNRLLQGDVGSGKTVVALYALLTAVANRAQAAIMAPTEILAEQHYQRFQHYLAKSRMSIVLLRGGAVAAERRENLELVRAGKADLIVGTHALIQKDVGFERLGVVVVDEQHKFGVMQRADLRGKGAHPDVLVMTATPIPRTLALTVFGDLDVSTLDEMPPGRRPAKSRWVKGGDERQMWAFIRERLAAGEQAYVVYPLVEESEKLDLRAATEQARHLQKGEFADCHVGLLHGRMRTDEKQAVMEAFRRGAVQVLVSTVVIEVGIDVPQATVMAVEHAERFGLSQLHQLRGRIGRGDKASWFFMLADPKNDDARARLRVIESTSDGFRVAEEDLRLRGPGEFLGTRQHGLPEWQVGDPIRDFALLRQARKDAFQLVARDGKLSNSDHAALKRRLVALYRDRMHLIHVG